MPIRPDVGFTLAARLANELGLQNGQANVIPPGKNGYRLSAA
jgi:hypothetical protein